VRRPAQAGSGERHDRGLHQREPQRDQAELGADLLGREEFTLAPGETRPYTKTLSPDTRFIGVFAAYRDLERAKWRTVLPVQPGKKQRIVIRAEELSVSAAATK
jgi:type VI secretion system protein VasD